MPLFDGRFRALTVEHTISVFGTKAGQFLKGGGRGTCDGVFCSLSVELFQTASKLITKRIYLESVS